MAIDLSKVAFYSGSRYERVVLKSHANFSVGAGFGTTTVTIPHNLGYKPFIKSRITFGDGKYFDLFNGPGSFGIDGNSLQVSDANIDTTNYAVTIENFGGAAGSGTIYYRIYAEPQV